MLNRGQKVGQTRLNYIANHIVLTKHAEQRIAERHFNLNVKNLIKNPMLAYYNTDGSINIALNKFEYLVVVPQVHNFVVVTFKEKSKNSINIFQKRQMAIQGYSRKE